MTQEQRERKLRQDIQAIRVCKFGWPEDSFHYILKELGFGESLRALDEARLIELKALMVKYNRSDDLFAYDKQGRYMHIIRKQAKWTDADLRAFLITHYHKSHWNILTIPERRAVIAMLSKYAHKQNTSQTDNQQ